MIILLMMIIVIITMIATHRNSDHDTNNRPPIKSLDSRGFDSNKLLILSGGNYCIHIIV